jgi:hypothetical protein
MLARLRVTDAIFRMLGPQAHGNAPPDTPERDPAAFESTHRIRLLYDYHRFLSKVGNNM